MRGTEEPRRDTRAARGDRDTAREWGHRGSPTGICGQGGTKGNGGVGEGEELQTGGH